MKKLGYLLGLSAAGLLLTASTYATVCPPKICNTGTTSQRYIEVKLNSPNSITSYTISLGYERPNQTCFTNWKITHVNKSCKFIVPAASLNQSPNSQQPEHFVVHIKRITFANPLSNNNTNSNQITPTNCKVRLDIKNPARTTTRINRNKQLTIKQASLANTSSISCSVKKLPN